MAVVTGIKQPPQHVWTGDLIEGQFYQTAQGHIAYVATRTVMVLYGDPDASIIIGANLYSAASARRFPFTRLPDGTAITITQEALPHA